MNLRNLFVLFLLFGVLSFPNYPAFGQRGLDIPQVSVCELIATPKKFEGKSIRVKATYRYGSEWSELYCSNCWNRDRGRIWISFDPSFSSNTKSKIRKTLVSVSETGRTVNLDLIGIFVKDDRLSAGFDFKLLVTKVSRAKIILHDSPIPSELAPELKKLTNCEPCEVAPSVDRSSENNGAILLEARYLGVGMVAPYGDMLIARINQNGNVEYEDDEFIDGVLTRQMKRAALSKAELDDLNKVLSDESIDGLNEEYASVYQIIDAARVLTLRIMHAGKLKVIRVVNFTPDHPKAASVYPNQLVTLARIADCTRANPETHIFFDAKECRQ